MVHFLKLLTELHRAFDLFNLLLANNHLNTPIITISPFGAVPMHGWFTSHTWVRGDEELHEINISAETLHRPVLEIMGTLLHEMAHLKNCQAGIVDINLNTQRHNRQFKLAAESLGLIVLHDERYGYATTTCGLRALEALQLLRVDAPLFAQGLHRRVEGGWLK